MHSQPIESRPIVSSARAILGGKKYISTLGASVASMNPVALMEGGSFMGSPVLEQLVQCRDQHHHTSDRGAKPYLIRCSKSRMAFVRSDDLTVIRQQSDAF
jgi:hypothetical protein